MDNSYLTYCSYHVFTLMSMPYFVPPLAKKWWGVKKNFCSLRSQILPPPHFQNRGAAPGKTYGVSIVKKFGYCPNVFSVVCHVCFWKITNYYNELLAGAGGAKVSRGKNIWWGAMGVDAWIDRGTFPPTF